MAVDGDLPDRVAVGGIDGEQPADRCDIDALRCDVVSHIVGITADSDRPARLQSEGIDQLQRPGVAVRDGDRVDVGNYRHSLRLMKARQRSQVSVLRRIDDFDRVVAERGHKQMLSRGIKRQVIDPSRHRGQRNRRQRLEGRRRLRLGHLNSRRAEDHQRRCDREWAWHHDSPNRIK